VFGALCEVNRRTIRLDCDTRIRPAGPHHQHGRCGPQPYDARGYPTCTHRAGIAEKRAQAREW
jgi:hypothetical protein